MWNAFGYIKRVVKFDFFPKIPILLFMCATCTELPWGPQTYILADTPVTTNLIFWCKKEGRGVKKKI